MITYEEIINVLLKLQKCYRIQGILTRDIVSRFDFFTKPRFGLSIAVAMWAIEKLKRNNLSYSELIYIQRRLASFISEASESEKQILRNIVQFLPKYVGFDINTVARRCFIDIHVLTDITRMLNLINESLSLLDTFGKKIYEPIKMNRNLCLDNVDLLPSANSNSDAYVQLIVKALNDSLELHKDPLIIQIVEIITSKTTKGSLMSSDIASIALISMLISKQIHPVTICTEPCIDIEAISRRLYNDLLATGVDPSTSDIYKLYQELSTKIIIKGQR